ncbi:MAG: pyridoxal 5'-phosphate synthase glutaminase subunit PdxT [Chloroflexi bacterium]|nr:pyridoxal 5'-phosphate synthase glutaminase subunit PdxT [Chloroflexota bacterium]MBT4142688.1 pyridoxal 5'-phosphate synthase glutaminase subunit PdxT [Chloroflexota bacterium]MBT5253590.1 pyridoxal 5'-phosphate synthase glutaminase subunit PdxT [Chloroflexota bacterium]MBT5476510.1 pyridoxal 5'-phosphate synthase glutaminase subunit PdxT [Chloroflexota bacterium]MBT7077895.1 pyridoxal 5'-phosphate synthase glutaminase subunit PdxT [Chloroflexota bacterium]
MIRPRIGVLALQGDFAEHIHMLDMIGIDSIEIRKVQQLSEIDGLIIPGGESTTIVKLLNMFDFVDDLKLHVESGMALWGTCAGMIVIARELADPYPTPINLIDIGVSRNYFGRQVDSFEAELNIKGIEGDPMRAVFIRAPIVQSTGDNIETLATVPATDDHPEQAVAVKSGRVLATSFHPELTRDTRLHSLFVQLAEDARIDENRTNAKRRLTEEPASKV